MSTKQEEIEDENDTKNVVANQLSKLTIDSTSDITPIDDSFLDESLLSLSSMPGFAKNINFLASRFLLAYLDNQDKRKFLPDKNRFIYYCVDCFFLLGLSILNGAFAARI